MRPWRSRPMYYTLVGHEVEPCTIYAWCLVMKDVKARIVRQTAIDEHCYVSTVFLGLDHSFAPDGPPLLFETMVFGRGYDSHEMQRYTTWDEAEEGHEAMVQQLLAEEART